MKHIFALLALVLLLPTAQAQDAFGRGKWLDLTHPFNERTIYWPTATPFAKTTVFDGTTAGATTTAPTNSTPPSTAAPTSMPRCISPKARMPATRSRWRA